jgi:hypothetical protein
MSLQFLVLVSHLGPNYPVRDMLNITVCDRKNRYVGREHYPENFNRIRIREFGFHINRKKQERPNPDPLVQMTGKSR